MSACCWKRWQTHRKVVKLGPNRQATSNRKWCPTGNITCSQLSSGCSVPSRLGPWFIKVWHLPFIKALMSTCKVIKWYSRIHSFRKFKWNFSPFIIHLKGELVTLQYNHIRYTLVTDNSSYIRFILLTYLLQSEILSDTISQYTEKTLNIVSGGWPWMLRRKVICSIEVISPLPGLNTSNNPYQGLPCESPDLIKWSIEMVKVTQNRSPYQQK